MNDKLIEEIVESVLKKIVKNQNAIPVEASGRHVHLSKEDAMYLFGTTDLTIQRELSQPEQYLYKEKVMLVGKKGAIKGVAILGPCRSKTQVELSTTDAVALGIKPIVRDSGHLKGASDILIVVDGKVIDAKSSSIIARRHIHMTPSDAKQYNVKDGDIVSVRVNGTRCVIFEDVLIRVHTNYRLSMHLDYDEANAVGLMRESMAEIVR